jgi:hypothetical protein
VDHLHDPFMLILGYAIGMLAILMVVVMPLVVIVSERRRDHKICLKKSEDQGSDSTMPLLPGQQDQSCLRGDVRDCEGEKCWYVGRNMMGGSASPSAAPDWEDSASPSAASDWEDDD